MALSSGSFKKGRKRVLTAHSFTSVETKGANNPRWKGNKASYTSFHVWLKRNYGSPVSCSTCGEKGHKEKKDGRWSIQWALKKGRKHAHKRENYNTLCRSCHRKYDMTPKERARIIALTHNQTPAQLIKLSIKRRVIALKRKRDKHGHFLALHSTI